MRRTKIITIAKEGRDKGKVFEITEMPAAQGERWAMRALLALSRGGASMPNEEIFGGMQSLAVIGLRALMQIDYADAEPLLEEMFSCLQVIPDPKKPHVKRELVDDDIEEISTRVYLRAEIFSLHTGFSVPAALSS